MYKNCNSAAVTGLEDRRTYNKIKQEAELWKRVGIRQEVIQRFFFGSHAKVKNCEASLWR